MYVAELNSDIFDRKVFDSQSELVEYYNRNHKGGNQVDVYEGLEESTGLVGVGADMFTFYTEDFGDIR